MNNINMILGKLSFKFENPLWLFAILVGVVLALIPFFRIRKDKRYTRERIVSMILHVLILTLASFVLAGFSIHEDETLKNDETLILIDVSDSNYQNSGEIAEYINRVIDDADSKNKVGIVAFGAGEPYVLKKIQSKPKVRVEEIWDLYDDPMTDKEGFTMTEGTDMASAIKFAAQEFSDYSNTDLEKPLEGCRMIIISDGIETDGNATSAVSEIVAMGGVVDAVYCTPKDYTDANESQIEKIELSTTSPKPLQPVEVKITVMSHTFGNGAKANFKIYDSTSKTEETCIADFDQDINSAEQTVITSVEFATGGLHTIKVEMFPSFEVYDKENYGDNSLKQNNVFYSYVVVQEKTNKILIIKGAGADATQLRKLIDEKEVGENGYEITEVNQTAAPTELSKYGEVILLNCNSSNLSGGQKLPNNYDLVLNNYIANGGGVLTMGGENTYYNGGMGTDKFNDFLPIKVKPEPSTNKAIVLLIDRSSAMCGEDEGKDFVEKYGKNRLQVVQDAFSKALGDNVFSPKDYVGVIFFGGNKNTPIEALQLSAASNIFGIEDAIGMDISKITGGKNYLGSTDWRHALEAAAKMLQPFQAADNKHIIMITDGAGDKVAGESSNLNGYPVGGWKYYGARLPSGYSDPGGIPDKCYTDYIYDQYKGITTSTINVGCTLSPAASYIEFMETASRVDGKKHYYYTETAQEIADAIAIECRNIPTKPVNVGQDYKMALQGKELTAIAADSDLPVLGGYNGATAKDGAGVLIKTASDPIYVEWEYGKGRVGSFMSSLNTIGQSKWASEMVADGEAEGQAVIKYLVDNCFRANVTGMTSDMNVEFNQKNFTTTITIKDISKEGILPSADGGSSGFIEAYYHSPLKKLDPTNDKKSDGTQMSPLEYIDYLCPSEALDHEYDQMVLAAETFSSEFRMMDPGLYTVAFLRYNASGQIVDTSPPYTYVSFSYSDEYDTYYDIEQSLETLRNIVILGNTNVTENKRTGPYYLNKEGETESIFSAEAQYSSRDIDPVFALMLAALVLFILDVCARKFHFPLPHDLFKKKKEENAN